MKKISFFSSIIFFVSLTVFAGCQKLESYQGNWQGRVKQTQLLRKGIDYCTDMKLEINDLTPTSLDATIQLVKSSDEVCNSIDSTSLLTLPSEKVHLSLINEYFNDSISNMTFDGEPLFTHVAFVSIGSEKAMVHISYFRGPKITVRMMSDEIYGVFYMNKQ